MKKIKLNLSELKVETFSINQSENSNGTIKGQSGRYCDPTNPCTINALGCSNDCNDPSGQDMCATDMHQLTCDESCNTGCLNCMDTEVDIYSCGEECDTHNYNCTYNWDCE